MKFIKGIMIGGLITTGIMMMYNDSDKMNKKSLMKKGKKFVKKITGTKWRKKKIKAKENFSSKY